MPLRHPHPQLDGGDLHQFGEGIAVDEIVVLFPQPQTRRVEGHIFGHELQ